MFCTHVACSEIMCRNTKNTVYCECDHALQRNPCVTEETQKINPKLLVLQLKFEREAPSHGA
jgi:hypothetical protein